MNKKFPQTLLVTVLINNRKKIVFISILCSTIAVGITFFIPKKYYAEGIVYPTNSNSIKEVVNNSVFGHEYQTDRLIQLFESQQMKQNLLKKFNLIDYYGLDTNRKDWRFNLNKRYANDISFRRSKYMAVKVSVNSSSPTMSANMVNCMLSYIDTIRKDILFGNIYALKDNLTSKVTTRQQVVDSLLGLISGEKRIVEPNLLGKKLVSKLEENRRKGDVSYGNDIIIKAAKNNYTLQNAKTINEYYTQLSVFSNLKKDLIGINEKISMPFPKVYIISSAIPDFKKSSPSFFLNAIIGLLLGLFGSITYFILSSSLKEISKELNDD